MTEDPRFPKLVSLACHDLRTPLATVNGFARTLERMDGLDPTTMRYLGMISAAAAQMGRLLDGLGLAAYVEAGRYDPGLTEVDSRELADAAAESLGEDRVAVSGEGARVRVDAAAARAAVEDLTRCALRHGGLERVELHAAGPALHLSPVTASAAPVLLGEDLRDLGAAVAGLTLRAAGARLELRGELLGIVLPAAK
jgi:signal transduction histidine kinase